MDTLVDRIKLMQLLFCITWHGILPGSQYFCSGKDYSQRIVFDQSLRNTSNLLDMQLPQKQSSTLTTVRYKGYMEQARKTIVFPKVKAIDRIAHYHDFCHTIGSVRHTFDRKKLMSCFILILFLNGIHSMQARVGQPITSFCAPISSFLYKDSAWDNRLCPYLSDFLLFFFWGSFLPKLNSHFEAWSYKKKKRSTERLKHTGNLFRKNLQIKCVC